MVPVEPTRADDAPDVAAVIKAVALLIHARADMERARTGRQAQPLAEPEEQTTSSEERV